MTPTTETKQSENGTAYVLAEKERECLNKLNIAILNAKAKLYDAREELASAQQTFSGAVGLLANSHGLGGGELTNDFVAIIKRTEA